MKYDRIRFLCSNLELQLLKLANIYGNSCTALHLHFRTISRSSTTERFSNPLPSESGRDLGMSGATPTLLPRRTNFPLLLPKPPQPHPIPLPKRRVYSHLNAFRDLQREMDDLSDEENELEDLASLFSRVEHSLFSHTFLLSPFPSLEHECA